MEKLFINIFQMSIAASYLILAVLFVRFLLRRAPKSMRSFLWLLVGIRLLIPFSVESVFSLIPDSQVVDEYIYDTMQPGINAISNTAIQDPSVSQPVPGTFIPSGEMRVSKEQTILLICTKIWLAGMALMLGYMLTSWLRLKKRVKMSVPVDIALDCGNTKICQKIYQNHAIESPFLFGIIKPRIYIPDCIADGELPYVVQHEMTHMQRKDYLIKPAGFLLLSVYWFNPCVWTAYIMLCKDIELICDEKVIRQLGASCKRAYSQALLNSASDRRMIAACPVAFGEVSVKERVKNVLNYKKPAFWVLAAAVLACIIVPVCFMTQKKADDSKQADISEEVNSEDTDTVEINLDDLFAGEYEMINPEPEQYYAVPRLNLDRDGKFSFSYNMLSSYLPYGTYEQKDNILTLVTEDGTHHYQFTCLGDFNNSILIFDAEHSSDVSDIDTNLNRDAPLKNGSVFIKNTASVLLNDAKEQSLTLNQEFAQGTTMSDEGIRETQAALAELQKRLTMEEMILQRQLEKSKELQLEQEARAVLETRLQELIQESQTVIQQLGKDMETCQSAINAVESTQTAYKSVEQWAEAFCGRDGSTIVKLAGEKAEQDLVNRDLLLQGFDGEKDYVTFGWSSPWPWGGNYGDDTSAKNYRIISVTDRFAEILYYAWVSDPHVTVWREQLTFEMKDDECIITSETLQFLDSICTAEEFWQAYPDGITGTMMDYDSYNEAGEALNNNAKNNRDSQWYSKLFEPDSAAVYLLNILDNPNKVEARVRESAADAGTCTVVIDFYEDGSSVSVQMVQPYGSDGIWVPYTGSSDVSGTADTASIAPYIVTMQNVDATITWDAKQLEALFPDHHECVFRVAFPQNGDGVMIPVTMGAPVSRNIDLNGDGVEEKIEFTNLGYNGGDGGCALTVTDTKTGEKIPLPDGYTEESGFPIRTFYFIQQGEEDRLLVQIGEEKKSQTVATIMLNPLYNIYERKNLYTEFKRALPDQSGEISSADALSGCNIVTYNNEEKPVILLKTYVQGLLGHIDTLGYVITELRLQEDNTWASRHYFLLDRCGDVTMAQQNTESTEGNGPSFLPFNDRTNVDFIQLSPEN